MYELINIGKRVALPLRCPWCGLVRIDRTWLPDRRKDREGRYSPGICPRCMMVTLGQFQLPERFLSLEEGTLEAPMRTQVEREDLPAQVEGVLVRLPYGGFDPERRCDSALTCSEGICPRCAADHFHQYLPTRDGTFRVALSARRSSLGPCGRFVSFP